MYTNIGMVEEYVRNAQRIAQLSSQGGIKRGRVAARGAPSWKAGKKQKQQRGRREIRIWAGADFADYSKRVLQHAIRKMRDDQGIQGLAVKDLKRDLVHQLQQGFTAGAQAFDVVLE